MIDISRPIEDLTCKRFGKLVVTGRAPDKFNKDGTRRIAWYCDCDCGTKNYIVDGASLRNTKRGTKSCGCLIKDINSSNPGHNRRHNMCRTRLYAIWCNMKTRCTNSNNAKYERYGGRGISICNEWIYNFDNFKNWAYKTGYNDSLTLDRIDYDGNYCPENRRWATQKMQQNNRSSNAILQYNNKRKTVAEWANVFNIKYQTLLSRLRRGWEVEKALTTPVRNRHR